MLIGDRLSELRKDKGLTQKELAEKLFINYRTYSSYEREETEPNDDVKIRIARFFNVSLDYLLGLTNRPSPIDGENQYIRLPCELSEHSHQELMKYINYLISHK